MRAALNRLEVSFSMRAPTGTGARAHASATLASGTSQAARLAALHWGNRRRLVRMESRCKPEDRTCESYLRSASIVCTKVPLSRLSTNSAKKLPSLNQPFMVDPLAFDSSNRL